MKNTLSIGQYLINRLTELGVGHVFGVPGDYVLGFYELLLQSKLKVVTTCDEQGAGFAADAYARLRGLGVVCVTYCVGGLKVANTTAEAFAEKSPVLVLSGAPGLKERERNPLLHHKVRDFDTQKKVFDQLTIASAVLEDPQTACAEIERVLAAVLRYKRPGYIELPRDVIHQPALLPASPASPPPKSDAKILAAAVAEAVEKINNARNPVILADVEIHRFALQDLVIKLAEKTGFPVASTILGKSVIGEQHPFYLGVYEGALGREEVRKRVEASDCLIMLGVFMTDINMGINTAHLDLGRTISATSEKLTVGYSTFENAGLKDFLQALLRAKLKKRVLPAKAKPRLMPATAGPRPITSRRLFDLLNPFLSEDSIVIADVGDALFGAADLYIHRRTEFLGPAYYASMGFAVPAALGAKMAAERLRPLVLVGDGAFQMTGMELSTIVRYKQNPIIILLNNKGYGTERHIHDGPFNDILCWNYSVIPQLLGAGKAFEIRTESEFESAMKEAVNSNDSFCFLNVHLEPLDKSPALQRLANRLAIALGRSMAKK